jgi:hypothetical protein
MENIQQQSGFFKHREHEHRPAMEIRRSSALFYVLQSQTVSTELLLFNYWLHKRGVNGLTLFLTLRSAAGQTLYTDSSPLEFRGAKTVRISELLADAELPLELEGSIEVEIFSPINLVIPYPAIIVRYHGQGWHTTTHSYSRIMSESSGDSRERMETVLETSEGNWTIHPDRRLETFFVIHNGPRTTDAHNLRMTLTNNLGETLTSVLPGTTFSPHETRAFFPNKHMKVQNHLNGSPGCLEVNAQVTGVFPRMLCGHRHLDTGALSIDHSNFNYTGEAGLQDCLPTSEAGTKKPLGFVVPTLADTRWSCYTDFYPTYPDRHYRATLRVRTGDGRERECREISIGTEKCPGLLRVSVSDLVRKYATEGAVDFTITHASRVPNRFHMGIHYAYDGGIPAFLIDGPMPYTATGVRSRWFPVIEDRETTTYLFISNQIFDDANPIDVTYSISVHNDRADKPLTGRLSLRAGETLAKPLEDIVPGIVSFLREEPGWVYLQSNRPASSVLHYAMVKGLNSVATDHAF